jgi:N6-L-threonylcarbamoyladenine synthase
MYILAIESSCDESAAAIINFNKTAEFKILSNIVSSQIKIHQKYGGVVPELAAREHVLNILPVIDQAISKAKIKKEEISAIAITAGPGLVTSLLSANETAKSMSYILNIPIIAINHIEGHIYSAFIEHQKEIEFPALVLTVSGGHNLLVLMKNHLEYEVIGETLDDAAGEAFDKASKMMGLSYPGGPIISKLAEEYEKNTKIIKEIDLPRPMINSKDFNFSFSGLKTALLYKLQKDKNWKRKIPQYSYSFQKAVVDTLVKKTIKAAKKNNIKSILLVGGVSANNKLKEEMSKAINEDLNNLKLFYPSLKYTGDNAAMISLASVYNFLKNKKKLKNFKNSKIDSNLEFK